MRTIEQLVSAEVHYCVSALVSALAAGYGEIGTMGFDKRDFSNLLEQALELARPIEDYESAAREAGWTPRSAEWICTNDDEASADSAEDACAAYGIDPHEVEVFEHWIVSDWLAGKLAEHGEKVDTDFAGLTVWARTTTGQGIASDAVIAKIHAELGA